MCEENPWLKPLMPMINANFWVCYDFGSNKYSCDCLVLRAVLHLGKQFRRLQFVVFLMNARKWKPLTDFSRIDRRHDLIVTTKNVDLSHQRHKIRNCHWKLLFAFSFLYFSIFVTNTAMAHEIQCLSVVYDFRFVFNIYTKRFKKIKCVLFLL